MIHDFLPVSRNDMKKRNWDYVDFVYVIGDAYVDHTSFGPAIISRVLESQGYRIGIISQPDWKEESSIQIFGKPRLGFLVSAGNMDTMVNHYTVAKKRRHQDAFTPGGVIGKRPDRATIVYCNLIRRVYKKIPIIAGGIEASLRRLGHYDYWSNKMKRSILLDSGANLISYGMGEHSIVEIADALNAGIDIKDITFVKGTVYRVDTLENLYDPVILPSYQELKNNKEIYAKSFYTQYQNTDPFTAKILVEPYKEKEYVVQNPPALPLTQQEMDDVYDLPYMRTYHRDYEKNGGIPAINELKFSLTSSRGCFGGCSFCALTFHEGRIVQVRSHESIINEAKDMIGDKDFKGYINDVGGPTANFRHPSCKKQLEKGVCQNKQCLFPKPCKNLIVDHFDYLKLLRKLRDIPQVKKVFIRSGLRFDYIMEDKNRAVFLKEICEHHISGQLRVAPEHICDSVLKLMGKPSNNVYEAFRKEYKRVNDKVGKKQFIVPYLISSHPGSTLKEAVELAEYIRDLGYMPEQVQDFYPTPSTLSTCMFYTGYDPRTMKKVYVPTSPHEKAMQRALIQYRNPDNYDLVSEALHLAHRTDLIGFGEMALIPPRKMKIQRRSVTKKSGAVGKKPVHSERTFSSKKKEDNKKRTGRKQGNNEKHDKKKTIRHVKKKIGKR